MTTSEIELANTLLQRYSERVGESVRPDLLRNIPIMISGDEKSENVKMWKSVGMANTRQDVKRCCDILTTFDLLTDEGPSRIPSRRSIFNDYKITKLGLTISNMDNGLFNFVGDNGKIDFSQLMTMSNSNEQKQGNISNTFVNSPVGQFQQANQTKNTKQKIESEEEVSAKFTIESKSNEETENKSSFYKILAKWWWAFIIPLIVTLI
tara:strand:- start:787 stop:1410 length:624 start_codon:yes stop_codon:yes gene_type:complete